MSLRLITTLTLVTLSGCDLDHQAGTAAIAELEGEFINTYFILLCYSDTLKWEVGGRGVGGQLS